MAEVTQFPERQPPPPLLVGPFEEWRVQVEGRIIPRLTGFREGETVWLVVDHRFGQPFPNEETALNAAVLIAQATAIAEGYPSLNATSKEQPFAPIGMDVNPLKTHEDK